MNPHYFSTTLLVTHWPLVLGLAIRVIRRRPPVGVSLAWLAVNSSTPFVGAALYLLFGEKRLGQKRAAHIAANIGGFEQWQGRLLRDHDAEASGDSTASDSLPFGVSRKDPEA